MTSQARPVLQGDPDTIRTGVLYALGAYIAWGIFPLYFKQVAFTGPLELVAQRVVWTAVLMIGLLAGTGRVGAALAVFGRVRALPVYAASALMISLNWLVFVYAVFTDRVVEVSLGFYINPLVIVLLGVVVLGERLRRIETIALGLAGLGVLNELLVLGTVPWISLCLAMFFAFYALIRKRARVEPLAGMLIETLLMAPLALAYLAWLFGTGQDAFALAAEAGTPVHGGAMLVAVVLLMASGPVTAIPLILFTAGANRLRMTTLGLMQYIAPSLHLALAVLVFAEPFGPERAVTFACIWAGLGVYTVGMLTRARRGPDPC